jgi:hypothetical protein
VDIPGEMVVLEMSVDVVVELVIKPTTWAYSLSQL